MVKSIHAPSHNNGKEHPSKPETQHHHRSLGRRSIWRCAWLCILRHHPASFCLLDDHLSLIDRSCPRHSFSRLATAPAIHRKLCLTFAQIQAQRDHDHHPRARPIFGICHCRLAASNHRREGGSHRHFHVIDLAGTRRRIHRQLVDEHDLEDHST